MKEFLKELIDSLEGNLSTENRSFTDGFHEEAQYIFDEMKSASLTEFLKFVKEENSRLSEEKESIRRVFRENSIRNGGKPGVSTRQFAFVKGKAAITERLTTFFEALEDELCLETGDPNFEESLEELIEEYYEEGLIYTI